eukprot:SAG31_NODE_3557_length_4124_cov_8.785342_1_plen_66_part_00
MIAAGTPCQCRPGAGKWRARGCGPHFTRSFETRGVFLGADRERAADRAVGAGHIAIGGARGRRST